MDAQELAQIIKSEGLDVPVIDGIGLLHDDAVVIEREGAGWKVYLVDERHAMIDRTLRTYDNESDAYERALLKLRQVKAARAATRRLAERRRDDVVPPASEGPLPWG